MGKLVQRITYIGPKLCEQVKRFVRTSNPSTPTKIFILFTWRFMWVLWLFKLNNTINIDTHRIIPEYYIIY